MSDPILDNLNDTQREAVMHREGPLLVLAGAGSGKTRVLVHRVAHLVRDQGVPPWRILCVTFTNKAAGEMRERLHLLLGPLASDLWVFTFHAFGARFLRIEAGAGLPVAFPIYDADDQLRLAKSVLAEMGLAEDEAITPRAALSRIDRWKNDALLPEEVRVGEHDEEGQVATAAYARYQSALARAGAADFGDLVMYPLRLLEKDERLRDRWSDRFAHILVDEFQDTNPAQYRLVRLLCGPVPNLCVVGDDDQAIYRWRGADVANILGFDRDYRDARIVKLEQNYRSSRPILDAANAVISRAQWRRPKRLWTERDGGVPLALLVAQDEHEEGELIARAAKTARAQGIRWEEIAVLYRTNAQSRPLEAALREQGIPYVVVRGTSFYERAEVKDVAAYLRLALAPRSDLDLLRVVNRPPRGVGEKSVARLKAFALQRELSLFDALAELHRVADLTPKVTRALAQFRELIADLHARVANLEAGIAVQEVLENSQLLERLKLEGTDESVDRIENLMQFLAAAREFDEAQPRSPSRRDPEPPLARFLERIALLGEADAPTPEGRVALMTLHCAKGLEFEMVVISGLEEGILPYSRPWEREWQDETRAQLDEERRLCYVGMTRAKRALTLSLARRRMTYRDSGAGYRPQRPSRFLGDLPPELFGLPGARETRAAPPRLHRHPGAVESDPIIELDELDGWHAGRPPSSSFTVPPRRPPKQDASDLDLDQRPPEEKRLKPGDRVLHASLGEGTVTSCDSAGPDTKVSVAFHDWGEKRVLARFLRKA
ncbi:MAG TPA: UvrD-helicase domain-containing protein [Anaeromyxobacteraceae bacterium]|nr:UvrD-helicase domain-containing protein [Anaeromyxobacteraceae bacterium]